MNNDKPQALSEFDPLKGITITYPPLLPSVRAVVRLIAKGLYISYHSMEWAYWNAAAGNMSKLNKIAKTRVYKQLPVDLVTELLPPDPKE